MEKQKIFWILITIAISIALLMTIIFLVFDSGDINQGKFRVSDVILASTVDITNKSEQNGMWSIDLSQNNKLSILVTVAEGANINDIYLSDVTASKDNVIFSQLDNENKINLNAEKKELDIEYIVKENNQILLEFVAINENILKNWTIPDDVKELAYDGRAISTANITLKDIQFKLKFKLNIVENNGKTNEMKVELILPNEELIKNGADVRRLSLSDFRFKVK